MGVRIDLPSAGLLGISGATVVELTADITAVANGIYYNSSVDTHTLTLPVADTGISTGDIIIIKNLSTGAINLPSGTFDGTVQTIEITGNQPVTLVFLGGANGYLIT